MTYEIHEACLRLPDMEPEEYESLKDSLRSGGLIEPIVLCDGKILDGRHRYRACLELEIDPKFRDWDCSHELPGRYVWAKAIHRNLSVGQRAAIWKSKFEPEEAEFRARKAAIQEEANRKRSEAAKAGMVGRAAAKAAEFSGGEFLPTTKTPTVHKARKASAEAAGVSVATMEKAEYVAHDPEELAKVANGEVTLWKAVENVQAKRGKRGCLKFEKTNPCFTKEEAMREVGRLAGEGVAPRQVAAYLGISYARVLKIGKEVGIEFPGSVVQKLQSINVNEFIESKSLRASALASGLEIVEDYIEEIDVTKIDEWVRLFKGSIGGFRRLVKTLEGLRDEKRRGEQAAFTEVATSAVG